ncbi:MFS general substrate transporter [Athelia psychrophila]|uniref:MFS general substrate transporter n=1 Tax=Athelia psychrophila TaxID=1759441 RepID=A0A166N856_9AGAM|nr:MFS general substrate transporter [Fibularhizoctonia sp. CBS 109695]
MAPISLQRVLRHARLTLTCISIVANALFGGGIFIFPLFSPALANHLKLTQPQLSTIVLAGMIGQYPFAAFVGKVIDRHGSWSCSLAAGILFSLGFGLFSYEISKTPDDIYQSSTSSFRNLTIYFFMAGLATVFALFSSLFAASKTFPAHLGVASGTSMALFGLSPLFLSFLASNFFTDPETGLNVTQFLKFLAVVTGGVYVIGAFNLRLPAIHRQGALPVDDPEQESEPDERSALLPSKPPNGIALQATPIAGGSTLDLLRDYNFWIMFASIATVLGSCEMVMSNIGTIVLSLPPYPSSSGADALRIPSADISTATQVRLISLANTITRLLIGPVADYTSPVALFLPSGEVSYPRRHLVSRVSFLSGAAALYAFTCAWMGAGVHTQGALWALSVGTGITYGITFTVLPSIISSIWGLENLGRNFGIATYAPFIGTPIFSYLYAFISASHAQESHGGVCKGTECWQSTFWISVGATLAALCGSLTLWRKWKGKV